MITDRIDPPGLLKIPEIVNVSIATGTRIVHISGQTSVDVEGKVVGATHLEQARRAFTEPVHGARRVGRDPGRRRHSLKRRLKRVSEPAPNR